MAREWVLAVRDRCKSAGVPFFFKQWGGVRKKQAGRELDGATYDEMPDVTCVRMPADKRTRLEWIKRIEAETPWETSSVIKTA